MDKTMSEILLKKLCCITHLALVQVRSLIAAQNYQRAFDLADTFEPVPNWLADWKDEYLGLICSSLRRYQDKYKGEHFDYLAILEMNDTRFASTYPG
jgi:hypothetical protein